KRTSNPPKRQATRNLGKRRRPTALRKPGSRAFRAYRAWRQALRMDLLEAKRIVQARASLSTPLLFRARFAAIRQASNAAVGNQRSTRVMPMRQPRLVLP